MIKLAEANRATVAALKYARDCGYSISVTVCDSMGHLIAHQRMDDALLLSGYGSVGKAIASAGLGVPSGKESDVDLYRSSVGGVLAHGLAVIRRPGGLPIQRGREVEGAIGVSGAPTDEQDEECARRGIKVIGSYKTQSRRRKHMNKEIKIVVIGGTGLIGSKVVNILRQRDHEVVVASPSSGVNTLTGEGLAEALKGAQVVVDVANSPSFEDKPALDFFETSGRNLLSAEKSAGVKHHVALSVVGTDGLTGSGPGSLSGYFRAKMAQENLIKASRIPFTIVHATQFFEFVKSIAQSGAGDSAIRLSSVLMQPMASDDVAAAVAEVALGQPVNGMIEIAGPDQIRQDELVRQYLSATGDARKVVTDDKTGYFGIAVNDQSLVPGENPRVGPTHYEEWLSRTTPQKKAIEPQTTPPSSLPGKVGKVVVLLLCGIVFAALSKVTLTMAATTEPKEAKLTELMSKDLTDLPGKEGLMLLIEYPPGSSDPIHRHNAHGFIYVLEGSIVMQVRGGKEVTLTPGQTFYEGPEDVHVVGRNASQTKPAKFVVFFVKDKGAPVLVPTK